MHNCSEIRMYQPDPAIDTTKSMACQASVDSSSWKLEWIFNDQSVSANCLDLALTLLTHDAGISTKHFDKVMNLYMHLTPHLAITWCILQTNQ